MLPIPRHTARVPFRRAPSVFALHYSDRFFAGCCWAGLLASAAALAGVVERLPLWAWMVVWALLWALYLSIVNVGQTWYGFGWETLLCEAGVLAVFLGPADVAPPTLGPWPGGRVLFPVGVPGDLPGPGRRRPADAGAVAGALAAVPAGVRRRADQAARRPLLAGADLPALPPRDPADAQPGQPLVPPAAAAAAHRRDAGQ